MNLREQITDCAALVLAVRSTVYFGLILTDSAARYVLQDDLDYKMIRQRTGFFDPSKSAHAILNPDIESMDRS